MNIATEIRLPKIRRKPKRGHCVKVYTTEAKQKPEPEPQPAPVPRLTEAEIAEAWRAMAEREGHAKMIEAPSPQQIVHAERYAALQTERGMALLRLMLRGPLARVDAVRELGLHDGSYFTRMSGHVVANGWAIAERATSNRVTFTITDAGRRKLASANYGTRIAAE